MNPPLIIIGSARKDGNTLTFIKKAFENKKYQLIDLLEYNIHPYNYAEEYPDNDQFLSIMEKIVKHEKIVWATPVYWYAVSGILKDFFDRLTDLTHDHEEIRKALPSKKTYLMSVGSSDALPEGFEVPFRDTAHYFDMQYHGAFYTTKKKLFTGYDYSHIYETIMSS